MAWLSQNWIWLVLGVGALFMMSRGVVGLGAGGHAAHGHGHAGARATGDGEQSGTATVADTAGVGVKSAQDTPKAHRRHGCC